MSTNYLRSMFGVYKNTTYYEFDPLEKDILDPKFTQIHEYTHLKLAEHTLYGNSIVLMDRYNKEFINAYKESTALKEFFKYYKNVTESSATFIEYCVLKLEVNTNTFKNKVKLFKDTNKEYYKYIKDLLPLLDKHDSETIFNYIYMIAELSLNVDLTKLNPHVVKNNKIFKRFLEDPINSIHFKPINRFKVLLKELKKILSSNTSIHITKELLVRNTQLRVVEFSYENQLKLIDWLCQLFSNTDGEKQIESIKNDFIKNKIILKNEIRDYNTSNKFNLIRNEAPYFGHVEILNNKFKYETKNINEFDYDISPSILHIKKKESSIQLKHIVHISQKCYIYNIDLNNLKKIINKLNIPIVVDYEIYQELKNNNIFTNKLVTIKMNFLYLQADRFINEDIKNKSKIYVYDLNNSMFFIFINSYNNLYYLYPVSRDVARFVATEVKEGKYEPDYAKKIEQTNYFEDIICCISERTYFDCEEYFKIQRYK